MNSITSSDRRTIEKALEMNGGYVLDFDNIQFAEFFEDIDIDIYSDKYSTYGNSKAKRLRSFFAQEDNEIISKALDNFIDYLSSDSDLDIPKSESRKRSTQELRNISMRINPATPEILNPEASPLARGLNESNSITLNINQDLYSEISEYLNQKNYYHAVEESYKIVREKLRSVTGKEKATEVFSPAGRSDKYYLQLFGKATHESEAEGDFYCAVGYLHLCIQSLRNEKVHTPAFSIDENLALHYISLSSLAYDLISDNKPAPTDSDIDAIGEQLRSIRSRFSVAQFYPTLKSGSWIREFKVPDLMSTRRNKERLRDIWMDDSDFSVSYDRSNIEFMKFELVVDSLNRHVIDAIIKKPGDGGNGGDQKVGLEEFLSFVKEKNPDAISDAAQELIGGM